MKHTHDKTSDAAPSTSSRRRFMATAGAAGALGLAGCSGGSTGGTSTITVGSVNPMSGPYSSLGPNQRRGAELAVSQINANSDYDFEFELVTGDSETEARAAQDEVQRLVQQEGADFIVGAISSSVALGINEIANSSEFVYFSGGAAVPITGSACNPWVFRFETNTAMIAEAISAYSVNELGTNVWFHYADYAYGQSVYQRVSQRMANANGEYNETGVSTSQLGASNYGSYVSQISNSDADIVVLGMTGGDLVSFTNQAADQGLTDDKIVIGPTQTFQSVLAGTGMNSIGTYGGVRYLPTLDTGDNQQFVDAYESEYDGSPGNFSRVGYDSLRLIAKGMNEAGSTEVDDVRDTLEGGTYETVLGDITLREEDRQATNPTWMGEIIDDGGTPTVDLINEVPAGETIPPASELGCN
ncbi:branched-chain amino acid ABC transporter substrate-binding protein (plasmid) [Halorubrum ezzemoulense]|uniref:Branched-chain amino acid ABC transporter substrate-binding protein n=2 Tax=Halorubrum ezzemoulense TaxID=337243 RepID=A0A256KML3_HALEZ|nr:branched-chain amino acid ABC transporter substrate-binding protein [Halorubrum ezzemoulense]QAY21904.1 branched-chain amino acid ABC transporter substrate-binding protein [Halorubrum ezzemoulense]